MTPDNDARLAFLPPMELRRVVVGGYLVPKITAREIEHGTLCDITLDNRMAITIPAEHAQSVIWLLANALAVGGGYSCHGEHSVQNPNPYKIRIMGIGTVTDTDGVDHDVGDAEP